MAFISLKFSSWTVGHPGNSKGSERQCLWFCSVAVDGDSEKPPSDNMVPVWDVCGESMCVHVHESICVFVYVYVYQTTCVCVCKSI